MSVSTRQGTKAAVSDASNAASNNGANESPQSSQAPLEHQSQTITEVDFHALFGSLLERVEQIAKEVASLRKTQPEDATPEAEAAQPRNVSPEEPSDDPMLGGDKQAESCLRALYGKFSPPKIQSRYAEQSIDQLESWLDINQIFNDRDRFLLLKMSIEPETYRQVAAALTTKNPGKEYETLKRAIIQAYTDSEAKQIQNLLSGLKLGDRRPSRLLAEMCDLYKGPKDTIFEELFLSRLPGNVRGILIGMRSEDKAPPSIETTARRADTIIEQLNVPPMISAITDNSAIAALLWKNRHNIPGTSHHGRRIQAAFQQSRSHPSNTETHHSERIKKLPSYNQLLQKIPATRHGISKSPHKNDTRKQKERQIKTDMDRRVYCSF